MTTHLATPAFPTTALCGDADARRFTVWRWKSDCALCKATSAPVAFDVTQSRGVRFRADIPIRFSKLVAHVRAHSQIPNVEEAIAEFERERASVGSWCPTCKAALPDPIALFDVLEHRMVFACPACSSPEMRARWEAEAG